MGTDWRVASERVKTLIHPTTRRVGVQENTSRRLPDKYSHAVQPGAHRTLCGREVSRLYRFDMLLFNVIGHHLRCPTCNQLVQRPT